MLTCNQILDMTPIKMSFFIMKTAKETGGQSLEMEWKLLPKTDGTPLHIHPFANETYKVIEGQVEVNINGVWKLLQKGEELTVAERTPHTFRNPANAVTTVYNIHSPAMHFAEYFEGLSNIVTRLSNGGKD